MNKAAYGENAINLFKGYSIMDPRIFDTAFIKQDDLESQQYSENWSHRDEVDSLYMDDIWLSPQDHRTDSLKICQRLGWVLISIQHMIVGIFACLIAFRYIVNHDQGNWQIFCLAVGCLTTDLGILSIVIIIYAVVYLLGGDTGVRTATGLISLLIDCLQALAYDGIAIAALIIGAKTFKHDLRNVDLISDTSGSLLKIYTVMAEHFEADPITSLFLINTIILGTFYLGYSMQTLVGILVFTYKSLFPQASAVVEFLNPSSRLAYVYMTGPNTYLDAINKLNSNASSRRKPGHPFPPSPFEDRSTNHVPWQSPDDNDIFPPTPKRDTSAIWNGKIKFEVIEEGKEKTVQLPAIGRPREMQRYKSTKSQGGPQLSARRLSSTSTSDLGPLDLTGGRLVEKRIERQFSVETLFDSSYESAHDGSIQI